MTTTTPVATTPTLVLSGSTNAVSATTPALLSATLKSASGSPLSGVVVTFATQATNFGTFFPTGATALTDANGIASITLNPGTQSGADAVVATASVNGATVTSNSFGYTSTGTTSAARVTLTSTNSTVASTSPATLSATVRDSSGALVVGTLVRFVTQGTGFGVFSPSGGTALTDATGVARISLLAGTQFGADTVTATATVSNVSVASAPLGFTVSGVASVARLSLTTSSPSISSSSPATLTATIVDASGAGLPNIVVTFTTQGSGYGTFFPSGGTALTNASGVATISLNAGTAIGADTVTASATVSGVTVSSSPVGYTVSTTPVTSTAASISFTSATPTTIAIRGTGGQENSAVVFTVRDSNGNALANQAVTFSLTSMAGGLALASSSGTSGADGTVSAILQAGTTATPVRVRAVLNSNTNINAVSSQLVVSTALPHQNGFSLAAARKNIEAFTIDNVTSVFSATLSDRYGNYVPDNTAVSFRTAGGVGSIAPSCFTSAGRCSATFGSAGARPANGRLVLLATAIGEESFIDLNGNGLYDLGEPFTDLPEAFIDVNGNRLRDPTEEFVDFNNNGSYDGGDGLFNGVLRTSGSTAPVTLNVRQLFTIVLSTSNAQFIGLPNVVALNHCVNGSPYSATSQSFTFQVADLNGNAMAPGTTIALSTSNGSIVSTPTVYTVSDDNTPVVGNPSTTQNFLATLISDAAQDSTTLVCTNPVGSGVLTVTVTAPSGTVTATRITITD